jgi:tetratricopeptide (TPR) repeat protein
MIDHLVCAIRKGLVWTAISMGCLTSLPARVSLSQDSVVVRNSSGAETLNRKGTIVEWKGSSLTLETAQRERTIDNDEILSFQTIWPASYREAQQAISVGKFEAAVERLVQAQKDETRPWAKRAIRAESIRVLAALGQWESAVDQFLLLVQDDPQTRFFYLCPIKWLGNASIAADRARALLTSRDPVQQLLGASWLVPGRDQAEAIQVLESLTADLDPRVQKLAETQLWRVRSMNLGSINDRQLEVWENKLAELPKNMRAGPWYLIAEVQMKRKQSESAIINWLRLPILYPDQYSLSASALYQSSLLLDNLDRKEEAQSLQNELRQKFGSTVWAKQLPPDPTR